MRRSACAFAAMLLAGVPVQAQSVADFYRGKQIRVIVGSARRLRHLGALVARHMRRHVPGDPTFVVETCRAQAR